MKKSQLREWIRRQLGAPVIEIELTDDQLNDAIDEAINKFVTFATGKATEEGYYSLIVSAGEPIYNLPENIVSVVDKQSDYRSTTGSFAIDDSWSWYYMLPYTYSDHAIEFVNYITTTDIVSLELVGQYLNLLKNYQVDKYKITYHDLQNRIVLYPIPQETFYLLLHVFYRVDDEKLYEQSWVKKYAKAFAKYTLGEIRSKYTGVNLPGGGSLNGDRLLAEATEEMNALLEALEEEEPYEGLGIIFD